MDLEFDISKYTYPLYNDNYTEADVYGGRGRGGSHGITQHCIFEMIYQPYMRGFFVRAIQGSIRTSLWQDFKDRLDELSELNGINLKNYFKLNESRMEAVFLPNGNSIKSKGFKSSSSSNTANMKSIAGATHIYGEEWEEVGELENNKLMDSLRTTKGKIKIIRSWNPPPKEHWLIKNYFNLEETEQPDYYLPKAKGISGHLALFGDYTINSKNIDQNTKERYERYKNTFPKYYWSQIKGYVASGGDKRVYNNWQKISYAKFMSIDGVMAYGLDFGDTAPTSLTLVKYNNGTFYRHQILYESLRSLNSKYQNNISTIKDNLRNVNNNENNNIWSKHKGILTYVFEMHNIRKDIPMFCDPAQEGLVEELRLSGFMAVKASKDKASNINFINRAENYYTEESHDLEAEYSVYYLEEDLVNKMPIDGRPKAHQQDHSMDSQEYACRGLKDMLNIVL